MDTPQPTPAQQAYLDELDQAWMVIGAQRSAVIYQLRGHWLVRTILAANGRVCETTRFVANAADRQTAVGAVEVRQLDAWFAAPSAQR
jgi:hypothetical protein